MTVCIAALSDDKKKAVLVADKLITYQTTFPFQVNGEGKIFHINDNVKVMYSGRENDALLIIEKVKRGVDSKKWITEIAEYVNQKHLEYLNDIIVAMHLTSRGIKSITEYYKNKELNLDAATNSNIDLAITTHNLNSALNLIVCGKDSDGLFKLYFLNNNPRVAPLLLNIGYAAIGSGANHALYSIIHSSVEYNHSLTAAQVKEMLLEAKKKAEKASDVGVETDIVIME